MSGVKGQTKTKNLRRRGIVEFLGKWKRSRGRLVSLYQGNSSTQCYWLPLSL